MLYFFDGTKEGFLSAFPVAFPDPHALLRSKKTQLLLGETPVFIPTDYEKAARVAERLQSFDRYCMEDLDTLFRSGMENNEQIAFDYFRLLATIKRPIKKRLAEPAVFHAIECIKKVGTEIHHFHGFIRFMETESGALYAPFSPDNDICDLLAPHFKARLPQFPFVLHDVKRQKATVYDGHAVFTAPLAQADVLLSADETAWQTLWKEYYRAVNIPSRERLRQMRGFMPARYWKFLPEKQ